MKPLNIVLVEPQIPQNTGNISRTCAATGARLHLVGPMGFTVDDKKLKRAGLDYWHLLDITYYESLADFFDKNAGPFYFFTSKGPLPACSGCCLPSLFLPPERPWPGRPRNLRPPPADPVPRNGKAR